MTTPPPLPSGYKLDQAETPPLPAGYKLDSGASGPKLSITDRLGQWLKGELQNVESGSGLPTMEQLRQNPRALQDAPFTQKLTQSAQMAVPAAGAEDLARAATGKATASASALNAVPNTLTAGGKFQQVMGAAKDVPVDITAAGNDALELKDFASRGGRLPKVVNDFVKRATDPSKGPITYEEARDFYSNARQLSVEEINSLKPAVKRQVVNFANSLGESIHQAASSVGQGENYAQAMKEYSQAKNLGDALDVIKRWGLKVGATATLGGAGYGGYKLFHDLF